jgi:hypothetical protein
MKGRSKENAQIIQFILRNVREITESYLHEEQNCINLKRKIKVRIRSLVRQKNTWF